MFFIYKTGIKVAKLDNQLWYIKDRLLNEWLDQPADDNQISEQFKFNPTQLLNNMKELQNLIDAGHEEFHFNGKTYMKHGQYWVQKEGMEPIDIVTFEGQIIAFISAGRDSGVILVKEGYEVRTPLMEYSQYKAADYTVEEVGTFPIEMRDGIHLSTMVFKPKELASAPAVLIRTPYDKKNFVADVLNYVKRGYVAVVQDVRGRDESEGEWYPCYYEIEDGDDTLNWIADLEYCDGNIGMIGGSYLGYVQWATAASGNPHLKAIVSIVTSGSGFKDLPYRGGSLLSGTLAWVFMMSDKAANFNLMQRDDWDELLKHRPIADIPKKGLGKDIHFWNEWCNNSVYNEEWKRQDWSAFKEQMNDIPALILSGWYNDNTVGTSEAVDILNEKEFSNYHLIFGPWLHRANSTREVNDIFLGKGALRYDIHAKYLGWFEKHLKSVQESEKLVEYYDQGLETWCTSKTWPPTNKTKSLSLLNDLNAVEEYTPYVYDPMNPAPHIIDVSSNEALPPSDYKEIIKRDDVVTFVSDALEEPISIAGDIQVNFYASTDSKDTDWFIRVLDMHPDGTCPVIATNCIKARFRNGFEKEELLEPNEIYEYQLRLSKVATTIKVDHKICLMITSSAEGFIFPNMNTGESTVFDESYKIANQRIYHSKAFNSQVILPIV